MNRVGAHLAVSSVFEEHAAAEKNVYCYSTKIENYERIDAGIQTLATGRASVQSNIVLEKHAVDFTVLHFGDHNLICAVNARSPDEAFYKMKEDLKNAFARGDTTEVMRVMNIFYKGNNFSLWHLFKDQQRRILYELLKTTWQEIEASFRHIYEHNYTIMQIMRGVHMPLPRALAAPAEFILNQDLCRIVESDETDVEQLGKLASEAIKLPLQLDTATLRFEASGKINSLMGKFEDSPNNIELLEKISAILGIILTIVPELDVQPAQNVLFRISREEYPAIVKKAEGGEQTAKKWCEHFKTLANYLGVKVD